MGIGPKRYGSGSNSGIPGVAVRRSSYPSGHWLDAYGNRCESPNRPAASDIVSTPATPKKTTKKLVIEDGNPDPNNWKILKAVEKGPYLLLMMEYPNCTNYEGKKILVFENITLIDLVNQKQIDPHFFPANPKFKSPIARFEPTDKGWKMAEMLIVALQTPNKR